MHRPGSSPLRRHSPEAQANRVRTVLDGPDAREAFDKVRLQLISDIEGMRLDGSPEKERKVLELVRQLHAFIDFKATLIKPLINERISTKRAELQENGE